MLLRMCGGYSNDASLPRNSEAHSDPSFARECVRVAEATRGGKKVGEQLSRTFDVKVGASPCRVRDTTSQIVAGGLECLGRLYLRCLLFLQPKHGAFNNGSKTLSSSSGTTSTWFPSFFFSSPQPIFLP